MSVIYRVAMKDVTRGMRDGGYPTTRYLLPVYETEQAAQLEADRLNNPDFGRAPKKDQVGWHYVEETELLGLKDVKRQHKDIKLAKRRRAEEKAAQLESEAARLRAGK